MTCGLARSCQLLEGRAPSGFVHWCSFHLVYSILTSPPWGDISYFPHFSVDETKAQRSQDICPTQTQTDWGSKALPSAHALSAGSVAQWLGKRGGLLLSLTLHCLVPVWGCGRVTALWCHLQAVLAHPAHLPCPPAILTPGWLLPTQPTGELSSVHVAGCRGIGVFVLPGT